ncbi:MAG: monovalent cation/H(+) antiporter subunit G [Deltaproteobacteria bacterium]|nr:monovalent cation/H(+) antiporter subunit G [Deltaproteobacteria bacterium]MBW1818311.1 monovalent cation/H(+) antiporter subunit G [Deltaproteobacteria bacterium]
MNVIVIVLLLMGLVFFTGGGIGIIRLPDFYTRLHPAGKLDTLGSLLMVTGLALYNMEHFSWETLLTSLKMLLIVIFVFLSSPTATHSIVDAGVRAGLEPWTKPETRE